MRERLIFLVPVILIPLAVMLAMLMLNPPPDPSEVAFNAAAKATATPMPAPTSLPPTSTPTIVPTPAPEETPTPTTAPTATEAPSVSGPSFSADVQPIFNERCVKCHAGNNAPRGLLLDSYEDVIKGGTYRQVVIPGDPEGSELVRRILGEAIPRMPFDGPPFLTDEQIALIQAWIADGAADN